MKNRIGHKALDDGGVIKHITPEGYKLVKGDPNLNDWTIGQLIVSERRYVEKNDKRYLYLLDEHDPQQVCSDEMFSRGGIGLTHISQLITEGPWRSMSELCFAYCDDRSIPFIAGAIILNDYLKCYSTFYEICSEVNCGEVEYSRREWMPERAATMPPIPYVRANAQGKSSAPGLNDSYLIKAYKDSGYTISSLAHTLRISRPTATKLVDELGIPNELRRKPEELKEYIEQLLDKAESRKHELHSIPQDIQRGSIGLPVNHKTKQRSNTIEETDDDSYVIDGGYTCSLEDDDAK